MLSLGTHTHDFDDENYVDLCWMNEYFKGIFENNVIVIIFWGICINL